MVIKSNNKNNSNYGSANSNSNDDDGEAGGDCSSQNHEVSFIRRVVIGTKPVAILAILGFAVATTGLLLMQSSLFVSDMLSNEVGSVTSTTGNPCDHNDELKFRDKDGGAVSVYIKARIGHDITKGQCFNDFYVSYPYNYIGIQAGRQGSSDVARSFFRVNHMGSNNVIATLSENDNSPAELNYWVSMTLLIQDYGTISHFVVAQGHVPQFLSGYNNYWFGAPRCRRLGHFLRCDTDEGHEVDLHGNGRDAIKVMHPW